MKRTAFTLFLGIMTAGLAVAGVQDFTIVNKTGSKIANMYISPATAEDWGKNVLSVNTLSTGDACDILVSRNENAEVWDLKVITPEGTTVRYPGLRLNDFSRITLAVEKGKPVAYFE